MRVLLLQTAATLSDGAQFESIVCGIPFRIESNKRESLAAIHTNIKATNTRRVRKWDIIVGSVPVNVLKNVYLLLHFLKR